MIKKLFFLFFFLLFYISAKSTHLDIRLFYGQNIAQAEVMIHAGNYQIYGDGAEIFPIQKGQKMQFLVKGDSVEVRYLKNRPRRFNKVEIKGNSFVNSLNIIILDKQKTTRNYDDDLIIQSNGKNIILTNHIDLEQYVAGVVQGESGGSSDQIEYFYVQSIISRTYALVNYLKHKEEGFNLCDGVHCQVYKGRCRNADISRAVARTTGDVIVDKYKHMISAAFHSNCGGQTVNSEHIWSIPTTYLKSVSDSFCHGESNTNWQNIISLNQYNSFLKRYDILPLASDSLDSTMIFTQEKRETVGPGQIPLKDFRSYFNLRSTWFDIERRGDELIFIGRGYGHGVGLCQQGAIRMAQLGYDYKEIIKYYYTEVEIVNYAELKYSFQP